MTDITETDHWHGGAYEGSSSAQTTHGLRMYTEHLVFRRGYGLAMSFHRQIGRYLDSPATSTRHAYPWCSTERTIHSDGRLDVEIDS